MSELKPCPCGKVPGSLYIEQGDTYHRYIVTGDGRGCCGLWSIEFSVEPRHLPTDSDEFEQQKLIAWNAAPRAANG